MTSLERMSYLANHDIYNSSVPHPWTSVVMASTVAMASVPHPWTSVVMAGKQ